MFGGGKKKLKPTQLKDKVAVLDVLLRRTDPCMCQVHLVLLQWIPWFLRMKRPGEMTDTTPSSSQADSQSKTLSSPTNTTVPTPVASNNLPSSLSSLQVGLAQLGSQLSQPHRFNAQPAVLPITGHPQPNGNLSYMVFHAFQAPDELEPHPRGRAAEEEAVAASVSGRAPGNTPVLQRHLQPFKASVAPSLDPSSTPQDPDAPVPSPGPCSLSVEAATGRAAAPQTYSGSTKWSGVDGQLQALLAEVQFLVERVREQDRQLSLAEQWQFAAAVIDRLFLVGFSVFNIICTIAILMAAPNFGEALSKDFL